VGIEKTVVPEAYNCFAIFYYFAERGLKGILVACAAKIISRLITTSADNPLYSSVKVVSLIDNSVDKLYDPSPERSEDRYSVYMRKSISRSCLSLHRAQTLLRKCARRVLSRSSGLPDPPVISTHLFIMFAHRLA
jgi:hypothetical protein